MTIIKHTIKSFPTPTRLQGMSLGQHMEFNTTLKAWLNDARTKVTWISKKRKTASRAFREFVDLYDVSEYWARFGENDDSIQIYYRKK